jgi:hypothetical protein
MSEHREHFQRGPSLISFIAMVILGLAIFAYVMASISARDALWFWPIFDHTPATIVVRCFGEEITVPYESEQFLEITRLFNEQLSGNKFWQDVTISDQTFDDYRDNPTFVILVFYYAAPVTVHTGTAMFNNVDTLLTPLVGRFASDNVILGAFQQNFTGGRVRVENTQALKDYISQNGLCVIK